MIRFHNQLRSFADNIVPTLHKAAAQVIQNNPVERLCQVGILRKIEANAIYKYIISSKMHSVCGMASKYNDTTVKLPIGCLFQVLEVIQLAYMYDSNGEKLLNILGCLMFSRSFNLFCKPVFHKCML